MGITTTTSEQWKMLQANGREDYWIMSDVVGLDEPFTRSNGTVMARVYERLTKASRRRAEGFEDRIPVSEAHYRRGVYDAFKALQEELDA